MYAIEPIGVVFPRDADDVAAVVTTAARFGVPVLPRGAGTSLAGQTVGRAVVIDLSRHMNRIIAIDPERRDRPGAAGSRPGPAQPGRRPARPDVRPGHLDQQPRHARRDDRQQLLRQPLDPLRHDDRPRPARSTSCSPTGARPRSAR